VLEIMFDSVYCFHSWLLHSVGIDKTMLKSYTTDQKFGIRVIEKFKAAFIWSKIQ